MTMELVSEYRKTNCCLLIFSSLILTSCGGSSGGGADDMTSLDNNSLSNDLEGLSSQIDPTKLTSMIGYIDINLADAELIESNKISKNSVLRSLDVNFVELPDYINPELITEAELPELDKCSVSQPGDVLFGSTISSAFPYGGGLSEYIDIAGYGYDLIDAGDTITLRYLTGEFAEYRPYEFSDTTYRMSDIYFDVNVGNSLTSLNDLFLDIPGGQFPLFENIEIYAPSVITNFTPAFSFFTDITANTRFRWDTENGSNYFVEISTYGDRPHPDPLYAADGLTVGTLVTCYVVDDGEFSFPAETKAQLGSEYVAQPEMAQRHSINFVQNENSMLVIRTSSPLAPLTD